MNQKVTLSVVCVALVAGAAIVLAVPGTQAEPSVQAEAFSVEDANVTTEDGVVEFRILVQGTGIWSDLPSDAVDAEITVIIDGPPDGGDAFYRLENYDTAVDGTDGELNFEIVADMLNESGWRTDDLTPPEGETVEYTLNVTVNFGVSWANDSGQHSERTSVSDEMTIAVTDPGNASDGDGNQTNSTVDVMGNATAQFGNNSTQA